MVEIVINREKRVKGKKREGRGFGKEGPSPPKRRWEGNSTQHSVA